MAKPLLTIPICAGLDLVGPDLVHTAASATRVPMLDVVQSAFEDAFPGSLLEHDLGLALGMAEGEKRWTRSQELAATGGGLGAAGWAALLSLDPILVDSLNEQSLRSAVWAAILNAGPLANPVAVVLAVAEAARADALLAHGTKPSRKATGAEARRWERAAAQLQVPHTATLVSWLPAVTPATNNRPERAAGGYPATVAALAGDPTDREMLDRYLDRFDRHVNALARPTDVPALPAVLLCGGLCGPRGVTLRPAGDSAIAWATAVWRVVRAPLLPARKPHVPKVAPPKEAAEAAVVVLVDGVVVAASNLDPTNAVLRALAPRAITLPVPDADAFMARATKERDERQRLPGEERVLEDIARGEWTKGTTEERTHARRLAQEFTARGVEPNAPRFVAVRDLVRDVLAAKRKSSRFVSVADEVDAWARALAELGRREEEARRDAAEAALLDALEANPPGILSHLLFAASSEADVFPDLWDAHVARVALEAQCSTIGESIKGFTAVSRWGALFERARCQLSESRAEVESLVACELDRRAGLLVFPCRAWSEAAAVAVGHDVAVAVQQNREWRVLAGNLLTIVRAGLMTDPCERDGIVTAQWSPYAGDASDITERAIEWAIEAWEARGWNCSPPSLADAVNNALAANAPRGSARKNKRR